VGERDEDDEMCKNELLLFIFLNRSIIIFFVFLRVALHSQRELHRPRRGLFLKFELLAFGGIFVLFSFFDNSV
jgi:hypothetical protein